MFACGSFIHCKHRFFKSPRLPFNWPTVYHAINSTNCPKLCAGCSSKHAQSDCPKQCKFESWKIFHTILVSRFPRESQKFNVDTNPHCIHGTVNPSPESIMYNNLWGFVGHQLAVGPSLSPIVPIWFCCLNPASRQNIPRFGHIGSTISY